MSLKSLLYALRQHPSGWLLAAQLFAILLYPFLDNSLVGRTVFVLFGNGVLALVLWVVVRSPMANWISWLLAFPAVGLSFASLLFENSSLQQYAHLLEAVVYFYAAIGLIYYMLADYRVTFDELLAAGATFTLLAWAFAFLYSGVQGWAPASFSPDGLESPLRSWMDLLYMSFSILSGVGLSDISPVRPFARALVMLEMFAGVMYIALVLSRLIGLTMLRARVDK